MTAYGDAFEAAKDTELRERTEVAITKAAVAILGETVTVDPPTDPSEIRRKRMAIAWLRSTKGSAQKIVDLIVYHGAATATDVDLDTAISQNLSTLEWIWEDTVTDQPVGSP